MFSCSIRNADPYRMSAELEMSLSNFEEARRILYLGTQAVLSRSNTTAVDGNGGLPHLLHTWAVCEWHLGNLERAELLFGHALRLTGTAAEVSPIRSSILYTIARFKHHRGELHLAQHCVGLVMKENMIPGGKGKVWALWAEIAKDMKNKKLEEQCLAKLAQVRNGKDGNENFSEYLIARPSSDVLSAVQPKMESLLRRDPWQIKLFDGRSDASTDMFKMLKLPSKDVSRDDTISE